MPPISGRVATNEVGCWRDYVDVASLFASNALKDCSKVGRAASRDRTTAVGEPSSDAPPRENGSNGTARCSHGASALSSAPSPLSLSIPMHWTLRHVVAPVLSDPLSIQMHRTLQVVLSE